jgi:hypothetical protein
VGGASRGAIGTDGEGNVRARDGDDGGGEEHVSGRSRSRSGTEGGAEAGEEREQEHEQSGITVSARHHVCAPSAALSSLLDYWHRSQHRRSHETSLRPLLTSKLFCIIPLPNQPRSPPLLALEQSLSTAAISAKRCFSWSGGREERDSM